MSTDPTSKNQQGPGLCATPARHIIPTPPRGAGEGGRRPGRCAVCLPGPPHSPGCRFRPDQLDANHISEFLLLKHNEYFNEIMQMTIVRGSALLLAGTVACKRFLDDKLEKERTSVLSLPGLGIQQPHACGPRKGSGLSTNLF